MVSCNFRPYSERFNWVKFAENCSELIACVSNTSPLINTDLSPKTWSEVLPYCNEPCPEASVLIIPPNVARLLVDSSGEKKRPYGLRY